MPETPSAVAGQWTWFDLDSSVAARYFRVLATSGTLGFSQIYLGNMPTEIPLARINRDDYTNLPNKSFQSSRPLQFWFDRQVNQPVMRLWPVPNAQASLNQIVLHLGNGASASAIAAGRPVDTSMGLTPLEGLVMGTRSGDIDAGIISYLARTAGMGIDEIETMLNRHSGMLGLSGESDFRVVHQRIAAGDQDAQLAYEVYIHRLRKYVGAYLVLLGHADVITFTAGVGENDAKVRRDALTGLGRLGIELDEGLNESPARGARRISTESSPTTVLVIPTDEELAIARASITVV